jgi:hypothetical protein
LLVFNRNIMILSMPCIYHFYPLRCQINTEKSWLVKERIADN